MPRKKKEVEEINLQEAISEYAENKNFTDEYVADCLKNAMIKAYCRVFLGVIDPEGGIFKVELVNSGNTKIYYGRTVTNPDDITDDFLQIDSDDPDVLKENLKVGDVYYVCNSIDQLKDSVSYSKFNKSWTTTFQSSITNAEKKALMDIYKGKIGDIVTGVVERYSKEKATYYVLLGKTQVRLEKRDLIGSETFRIGEEIKMYLQSVESDSRNGAILRVSRSCPEFLRRVFENEVHEVYDGTVIIQKIAREAGVRSKIAVYTNEPNVDPCGACIGVNGGRIQAITKNLGNAQEKEKIDVVLYDPNLSLFIAEALVPAHVIGVKLDDNCKNCVAIVRNGELSLAIGKAGINVKLAGRLANLKIDIKEQDAAFAEGLIFTTIEDIKNEVAAKQEQERLQAEKAVSEAATEETPKVEQNIQQPEVVIEKNEVEKVNESPAIEKIEEEKPVEESKETVEPVKAKEEVKPVEEKPAEEKVEVKVTTSITELEKEIEEEKKRAALKSSAKKVYKKPKKDVRTKQEKSSAETKDSSQNMAIYTEEELAEIEKEEAEDIYGVDESSSDYEEYDDDTLYSDENK